MGKLSKLIADSHIHSEFSSDSEEKCIDIINKAVSLGLKVIYFTDHNDYDFPKDNGKEVFILDYDRYINTLQSLKENYKNVIEIRAGVEQGLTVQAADRVNSYDSCNHLDYIIGSSHLINGQDPYYPEFWNNHNSSEIIEKYYGDIVDNIKVCSNFDVYGHLDYIIRYCPSFDKEYNWKDYYDYFKTILINLIEKGKGIEVNSAGLKYGLKYPNPEPQILELYRQLGGEIITVGSDAHSKDYIAYEFDTIHSILENSGFKYYTLFKQRKPEFIKLS